MMMLDSENGLLNGDGGEGGGKSNRSEKGPKQKLSPNQSIKGCKEREKEKVKIIIIKWSINPHVNVIRSEMRAYISDG